MVVAVVAVVVARSYFHVSGLFFSLLVLIHRTCKWFLADEKEAAKGE